MIVMGGMPCKGSMSSNLKVALQENELVETELAKVSGEAAVIKSIGNICIPLSQAEAQRINRQRIQFLKEQIKNHKE